MQVIKTKEAFKELIQKIQKDTPNYINPLAFGICKVVPDTKELQISPQINFIIVNYNENFASAAIFIQALKEQKIEVDFKRNEAVCAIDAAFLKSCLNAFTPYFAEVDAHKNIQTILALQKQMIDGIYQDGDYKVTFIFKDESLGSAEATSLKLTILKKFNITSLLG